MILLHTIMYLCFFLSSGIGAASIPDEKKMPTLISMEQIHDDKLK